MDSLAEVGGQHHPNGLGARVVGVLLIWGREWDVVGGALAGSDDSRLEVALVLEVDSEFLCFPPPLRPADFLVEFFLWHK